MQGKEGEKIEWQAEQEKKSKIGEWLAVLETMRKLSELGVNTPPCSFSK